MLRTLTLAGRGLLLLALSLAILPACGGTGAGGGGGSAGLQWNSTSTGPATGGGGGGGLLWVDPNTGLGGGGMTGNIRSVDSITYSFPTVYIADNTHPLSTSTTDQVVNQAENGLMQAINGYRSRILGGLNGGNGGIGGGIGGGGVTLPGNNVFLQGHNGLIMNARAHSKHSALFHPGALALTNPEGDSVNGGGVAPAGRLMKTGIRVASVTELVLSGPEFGDFTAASNELTSNFGDVLAQDRWTHFGVGYWKGGSQQHYWSIILAQNPSP